MREIKFRAWDKTREQMVDWLEVTDQFVLINQEACLPTNYVYMQYTGLTDRLGKDIYEGDIVSAMQPRWDYDPDAPREERRYIVEWENENSRFVNAWSDAEVIGNIYENPELLTPNQSKEES